MRIVISRSSTSKIQFATYSLSAVILRPLSKVMRNSLLSVFFILVLSTATVGQPFPSDTSFVQQAKRQAIRLYDQSMHGQEHVYEGNEYIAHDHRIKIHPFYLTDSLRNGTLTYRNVSYQGVPILYDIVRDELAIQPPESGYRISPHTDKIESFTLGSLQFVRLTGDSASGIPTGFYEILHNGPVSLLAHRIKTVHEDISSGVYKADYVPKDRFFVQKSSSYHEVKTKRSVLSLFPNQSKPLRKFLRTNKFKFNDEQRETALVNVIQWYNERAGQ